MVACESVSPEFQTRATIAKLQVCICVKVYVRVCVCLCVGMEVCVSWSMHYLELKLNKPLCNTFSLFLSLSHSSPSTSLSLSLFNLSPSFFPSFHNPFLPTCLLYSTSCPLTLHLHVSTPPLLLLPSLLLFTDRKSTRLNSSHL